MNNIMQWLCVITFVCSFCFLLTGNIISGITNAVLYVVSIIVYAVMECEKIKNQKEDNEYEKLFNESRKK